MLNGLKVTPSLVLALRLEEMSNTLGEQGNGTTSFVESKVGGLPSRRRFFAGCCSVDIDSEGSSSDPS